MDQFSKTFTDSLGREWTADLTVGIARRLKEFTGCTLDELVPRIEADKASQKKGNGLAALAGFLGDPFLVFDTFYAMIKPVADQRGLSKEQVEEGIGEVQAVLMGIAVQRAIHDFFHLDPARQGIMRKLMQEMPGVMAAATERIKTEMDKIDMAGAVKKTLDALPGLDADKLNADLQDQLSKSASGSPAT